MHFAPNGRVWDFVLLFNVHISDGYCLRDYVRLAILVNFTVGKILLSLKHIAFSNYTSRRPLLMRNGDIAVRSWRHRVLAMASDLFPIIQCKPLDGD